jgi:hypothetical protein
MTPEELIEQAARSLHKAEGEAGSISASSWPWEDMPDSMKARYRETVHPTVSLVLKAAAEVARNEMVRQNEHGHQIHKSYHPYTVEAIATAIERLSLSPVTDEAKASGGAAAQTGEQHEP